MAVRLTSGSGQALYRTANLPAANAYTISAWFRRTTNTGGFQTFFWLATTGSGSFHGVSTASGGANLVVYGDSSSATTVQTSFATGSWFFCAMRSNGTNVRAFYRPYGTNALTAANDTFVTLTPTSIVVGNADIASPGDDVNGRVQNVKCWNRALSDAEILIESYSWPILFPSSVNFHWPLYSSSATFDISGNARAPTILNGPITTEDGVGLYWPRRRIYLPAGGQALEDSVVAGGSIGALFTALAAANATVTAPSSASSTQPGQSAAVGNVVAPTSAGLSTSAASAASAAVTAGVAAAAAAQAAAAASSSVVAPISGSIDTAGALNRTGVVSAAVDATESPSATADASATLTAASALTIANDGEKATVGVLIGATAADAATAAVADALASTTAAVVSDDNVAAITDADAAVSVTMQSGVLVAGQSAALGAVSASAEIAGTASGALTTAAQVTAAFAAAVSTLPLASAVAQVNGSVSAAHAATGLAAAIALVSAGVGAGDAEDTGNVLTGLIAADASAAAIAQSLADALAALAAGVAADELWAVQAESAAFLASAGLFGSEFAGDAFGAATGVVSAETEAAALFIAAVESIAVTVAGSSIASVTIAVVASMGQLTTGASIGAVLQAIAGNPGVVSAGVDIDATAAALSLIVGSVTAGLSVEALTQAASASLAQLTAGATFVAAFISEGGVAEVLPPPRATSFVVVRERSMTVPSRVSSGVAKPAPRTRVFTVQ